MILQRVGEDRRRRRLFADDDARAMRHLAVAHDGEFEIGNIHLDPLFAEVARQPAPPLHIGDDFGFDPRGRSFGEPGGATPLGLACGRQDVALGDAPSGCGVKSVRGRRAGALRSQLDEFFAQLLIAIMRGIIGLQRVAGGCAGAGDFGHGQRRIGEGRFRPDEPRDALRFDPGAARLQRIGGDCLRQSEFVRRRGRRLFGVGRCIGAKIEPVVGGEREARERGPSRSAPFSILDPERREISSGVGGRQRRAQPMALRPESRVAGRRPGVERQGEIALLFGLKAPGKVERVRLGRLGAQLDVEQNRGGRGVRDGEVRIVQRRARRDAHHVKERDERRRVEQLGATRRILRRDRRSGERRHGRGRKRGAEKSLGLFASGHSCPSRKTPSRRDLRRLSSQDMGGAPPRGNPPLLRRNSNARRQACELARGDAPRSAPEKAGLWRRRHNGAGLRIQVSEASSRRVMAALVAAIHATTRCNCENMSRMPSPRDAFRDVPGRPGMTAESELKLARVRSPGQWRRAMAGRTRTRYDLSWIPEAADEALHRHRP